MPVIMFSGRLSPDLCQRNPETTFVFGDNLLRFGKGGQAIIRSEPNALGVPTKRKPSMAPGSFFEEGNEADLDAVLAALSILWTRLENGLIVVFPVNSEDEISLGLERAELRERAPSIYATICQHVREMRMAHGWQEVVAL